MYKTRFFRLTAMNGVFHIPNHVCHDESVNSSNLNTMVFGSGRIRNVIAIRSQIESTVGKFESVSDCQSKWWTLCISKLALSCSLSVRGRTTDGTNPVGGACLRVSSDRNSSRLNRVKTRRSKPQRFTPQSHKSSFHKSSYFQELLAVSWRSRL